MSDVRERHRPCCSVEDEIGCICVEDGQDWPCDAIQQADRADAAEHELSEMTASATAHNSAYIAARDDADRLAAALRPFAVFDVDYPRKQDMRLAIARAALRQHEEATR